jgi:hypothetical protein
MPPEAARNPAADCSKAKVTAWLALFAVGALSTACGGGGGGGGSSIAPPPNPLPGNGWLAGVFQPSSSFAGECAAPRSGLDPATNFPYPDVQGSVLTENNWLRSWSDELYLWYSEIVDRDPGLYATTSAYFDLLRTTATTLSGTDKDQFHFTYASDEWYALSQSGVSAGYGVEWALLSPIPPREAVVIYVEPGSPAAAAGIARGARLTRVDDVDFIFANTQAEVDTINNGVFPDQAGETHSFQVQNLSGTVSSFTMQSADVTSAPVHNVDTIDWNGATIGYLVFNDHIATAEQALVNAITTLDTANIDDLVLDVRYNGGGYLVIASQLAYMIAGDVPTGSGSKTFEELRFSDKHPTTNPITGAPLAPDRFATTTVGLSAFPAGQPLPTLDLQRVFVITGPNTCSASESIINGLRGVDVEVIQIGSTTCGKPYGFYPQDNCGTTYFSIQFQGVNAKSFGDYTDGFSPQNTQGPLGMPVPGCSVADDYTRALGDVTEARLAAALAYRDSPQTCPTPSGIGGPGPGFSKPGAPLAAADGRMLRPPWRENRILEQRR